jgi:peptide/nickel transport system substrate-binding protein
MTALSVRKLATPVLAVFLVLGVLLGFQTDPTQALYKSRAIEQVDTLDPASYRIAVPPLRPNTGIWFVYMYSNFIDSALQRDLYPTLYRQTEYMRLPVPHLASDFPTEFVQDGSEWVSFIDLKQGVKWSDGSPVTAQDVVFSINTIKSLGLHYMGDDFSNLAAVEALSAYQLKFSFIAKPGWVDWPNSIVGLPIAPSHYWSSLVETAKTQPDPLDWLQSYPAADEPTCGPYKRSRWENGLVEHVADPLYYFKGLKVIEYDNGAYWEELPGNYEFNAYGLPAGEVALEYVYGPYASLVQYIAFESIEDSMQALKTNQVDIILDVNGLSLDQSEDLNSEPGINLVTNTRNSNRILGINFNRFPLNHPEIREAIDTLVDREYISQFAVNNLKLPTTPIYSLVSEENRYWYWPTERRGEGLTRKERIEQAVNLLKGAGFTWTSEPGWDEVIEMPIQGIGLSLGETQVLPMELLTPDYDPIRVSAAELISEWLTDIGIPTLSHPMELEAMAVRVFTEKNFDTYFLGIGATLFPGDWCDMFHSQEDFEGGSNAGGFHNLEFDGICDSFSQASDIGTTRQLVYDLQEILITDLPAIPIFSTTLIEAYRGDRVAYPYTQVMDGFYWRNGIPSLVKFVPVTQYIPETGGTLNAPGAFVSFPPSVFDSPVEVTFEIQPPSGSQPSAGFYYQINAVYTNTGQPAQPLPGMWYTITVAYDENALPPGVNEATLQLYYWDPTTLAYIPETTSQVDTLANTITATPDHFSLWGVFGEYSVFLPCLFP